MQEESNAFGQHEERSEGRMRFGRQAGGDAAVEDDLEPECQVGRDGAIAAGDAMHLRAADAEGLRRFGVGKAKGLDIALGRIKGA